MILPDLNLILYAHNRGSASHLPAKDWWEATLSSPRPVALCWAVMLGFVRLSTQRKIFRDPLSASAACNEVRAWLAQPQVIIQCELCSTDADFSQFPGLLWTNPLATAG